jgi:hypothetical protein
MRRVVIMLGTLLVILGVAAPANAFFHDSVHSAYLHTVLDILTLAVITAPLWTAYLWGGRRRGLLLAVVSVVQLPVAVIGFVPIVNPILHLCAALAALALTGAALVAVRRADSAELQPRPASDTH